MLNGDQLRTQASALKEEIKTSDNPPQPEESTQPASTAAEPEGASPGASTEQAAPGAEPEPEVIENPAPMIAAMLKRAIQFPLVAKVVPPRVLAVFDEATLGQLADAVGPLVVKWGPLIARWINASEKISEEAAFGMVLLGLVYRVYEALQLEAGEGAEQQQPGGERELNPEARRGWESQPPPKPTDAEPVSPIG